MIPIKIYNSDFTTELAELPYVISATRKEQINGVNTLDFRCLVDEDLPYIEENNTVMCGGDKFDIAYYKPEQGSDGRLLISVECEHVSYRLNNEEYNVEFFTEYGTPTYILEKILSGTPFSVDTVEYSSTVTFSLQQATSRRALLMQFVAYLGGELMFDGFKVSILTARGNQTATPLVVGEDVTVISKAVDKRKRDDLGNPTVSYTCRVFEGSDLSLGDKVTLEYDALGIDVTLRIVTLAYDPYNPDNVTIEIGNYINSLEDDLHRIETQAVKKDALYNGIRIGPEYGFEAVRNDKKARAYFRSDEMKFQSGDGSGSSWTDRLYYEYDSETDETTLVFNGKFTAESIEALSLLVTQSFYAEKGYIAGLTVDSLDTSQKLQKYLNEDTSEVNYIRIEGQNIEFCTDSTDGSQTEQARTRNGELLYWTDENYEYLTTSETEYPAMQYVYGTQLTKLKLFFEHDGEYYIPKIVFGAGTGTGNNGKLFMFKDADEFRIDYNSTTGQTWSIWIDDDGIHFDGVPEIIHETVTKIIGLVQVWVQADTPVGAKVNDLHIDTDDYSRYDVETATGNRTLAAADNEVITCNGTFTVTLHDASYAGIVKRVFNIGTGVITLSGNINGNAGGMRLFPNESVELITDGSGWRAL